MADSARGGVLRHRNFRHFFVGDVVNTAGTSMSAVALAFAVLHISDSATALGWAVASWTVPMVAFMLLGGAVADRMPRALVLRGSTLLEGLAQLTAAVLVLTGQAEIWQLCVLRFVAGSAHAVSYPAFHGMVPVLLEPVDRKRAYLLIGQARSALRIVGPAVAGLLVVVANPGWALLVDGLTYLVAAVFLSMLRLPPRARPDAQASVLADFAAGWGFARSLGWVLPVALCSLVYNSAVSGGLGVVGPVIANSTGIGAQGWGLAKGAEALGLFLFAFVLRRLVIRRPLVACQVGSLAQAVPMLALGVVASTVPLSVAMLVAGCGSAVINLAWNLTVQEKVPEHMLSRIMAIDGFFSFVAMPLGQLAVGPLTTAYGPYAVEFGCAAVCLATFGGSLLVRPVRRLTLAGPAAPATS